MYATSLIMIASWPVLIVVAWLAVRIALYFYEKKQKKIEKLIGE